MLNNFFTASINLLFIVLALIPRSLSLKMAVTIGRLWFAADGRHRNVAMQNLKLAFGHEKSEKEIRGLARAVFENIAMIPFEIGWSVGKSEKELMAYFDIKGWENFRAAHLKGKGIIMITAHAGNWELLPVTITSLGYPVSIVYRPLKFKPADVVIYRYRSRFGAKMVAKRRSLRKIALALKQKECVGILLDQDPGLAHGVFVDFFGQPTCTNKGVAFLALRMKAPVLPVFLIRQGKRYMVNIGAEIPLFESSDMENDIAVNTLAYNKALEEFIRQYPEQWFWVHRRWKRSPK